MCPENSFSRIPAFDLTRQNAELGTELLAKIDEVVRRGHFILGENVKLLEEEIAHLSGVEFGVGVANGSDALHLALLACNVGPGDEVITTPFTFFATAGAIARLGSKPVFCDIDPVTFNLDPALVEAAITPRTKALMPVHLYGQPAEMAPLLEVAKRHRLWVIEDAAQAIGAGYHGQTVGSLGDIACLSFFPTKNLGAFGDGGMVLTSNPELAERVRTLRVHGARKKYYSEVLGYNSRLDELQAAILRVKLPHLPQWIEVRRRIADQYIRGLSSSKVVTSGRLRLPSEVPGTVHVFHQFTVATPERDQLRSHLEVNGIGSQVYYPTPLHLLPVFSGLGYRPGDFPQAERACAEVVSLPMFPEMTAKEVARVIEVVGSF